MKSTFRVPSMWIVVGLSIGACTPPARESESTSKDNDTVAVTQAALTPVGWTHLAPYPGGSGPQSFQLLMDGSVLAADGDGSGTWRRFTPSPSTGYIGGSWGTAPSSRYGREGYVTGMLRDGRYWVGGGEHTFVNNQEQLTDSMRSHCEIYNPATNSWSDAPDFPQPIRALSDGLSAPLPDGTLLVVDVDGDSRVFNSAFCPPDGSTCGSGAWTNFDFLTGSPFPDEGSITMLWNGNMFLTQAYSNTNGRQPGAALYRPNSSPRWLVIPHGANQGPVLDPFNISVPGGEGGSALVLYDGRVFIAGGSGHNAIYDSTPGLSNPIQNTADTPGLASLAENNQVVLPTGHVLAVTQTAAGFKFYEYTPPAAGLTQGSFSAQLPGSPTFSPPIALVSQTLLPDGTAMIGAGPDIYLYRPSGNQVTTGRATIATVAGFVNGVYTLTGTNLNGLTNGSNRDDEGHNYTSFPIVAATFGSQTQYCPVVNLSSTAIGPNVQSSIEFRMPSNVPVGSVTISVSASGLQGANTVVVNNSLYLPIPDTLLM